MTHTTDLFVPPAAEGLPLAALDSATVGADRLDAAALTPTGRNFLAHALVQLARDGWLRQEAADGFEPMRDRETPEPAAATAPPVSPPADRTGLRDRIAEELAARFTADGSISQGMRVIDPDDEGDPEPARRVRPLEAAVAVLAVLPPPADRAAVPHDVELLHVVDAYLTATHVARHDVIGENGSCAGCQLQERVRAVLRRVAATQTPSADRGAVLLEIATTLDGLAETDMIRKRRSLGAARRRLAGELRKMAAEQSAARPVVGEQPDTQEADRIVAYRNPALTKLHCLRCTPHPAGDIWTPVTAGELEDGGICTVCGVDVLIEVKPS